MVWRGEHRAGPKSRGGSAPWSPSSDRPRSADRAFWSTWGWRCSDDLSRKAGYMFGIVQYQKNAVPKAAVFRSLHGCEVDLYVKLSHSGLSKNIMCLA